MAWLKRKPKLQIPREFVKHHAVLCLPPLLMYLAEGETGYITPWQMYEHINGHVYVNGDYTPHKERGGTVQMGITRHGNTVTATIPADIDHRWPDEPTSHHYSSYVEVTDIVVTP